VQVGLILLTFVAGMGLVLQVSMNAAIGQALGRPVLGVLLNFVVGLIALSIYVAAIRTPVPNREMVASVPTWAWLGGLMGAFYVAVTTVAGPRLGAVVILAAAVAGQMIASLLFDHYGLLGFPEQPITATRMLGVVLLCAGIVLVAR
jgi:transporter family-2 protein